MNDAIVLAQRDLSQNEQRLETASAVLHFKPTTPPESVQQATLKLAEAGFKSVHIAARHVNDELDPARYGPDNLGVLPIVVPPLSFAEVSDELQFPDIRIALEGNEGQTKVQLNDDIVAVGSDAFRDLHSRMRAIVGDPPITGVTVRFEFGSGITLQGLTQAMSASLGGFQERRFVPFTQLKINKWPEPKAPDVGSLSKEIDDVLKFQKLLDSK
ncbi:MAG: hypothetical protein O3C40_12005 [Planctomycetota bacterium]|nr:hypothetical protein [Planctomycetota bacterium]